MARARKKRNLTKSEQMARVRNKNTKPEQFLRSALWRSGYRYRVHTELPGTPDIVFPAKRLAVFVDGCFWHGCPVHYKAPARNASFWQSKLERNRQRDRKVDKDLEGMGWQVIRIWEHQITHELNLVVSRLHSLLD